MKFSHITTTLLLGLSTLFATAVPAADMPLNSQQQLAEDILRQLIEFETTEEHPEQNLAALEAMAERLRKAGLPDEDIVLVNPDPGKYGLVARLRGIQEQKPLLTMAHIDVVTANPDAWAFPPFSFGKKEGYYFGRGTQDNKTGVAHLVANFIRLQQEKFVPNRDLIMMLTGDEETEGRVADWLATEGKELIDAEFALNTDGGGGEYDKDFKPRSFSVQTSEKIYQTYQLTATNPGGHSSIPRPENAINQLAQALVNIANYQFPYQVGPNTRLMFARAAELETGQTAADMADLGKENFSQAAADRLAQDPYINAILRTTCVATELTGGHAENALPRNATATINCRIVPGVEPAKVLAKLKELVNDPGITFSSLYDAKPSPPSVMPASLQETLERLVEETWPGIPVMPEMSTGATDGLFVRNAGIPVFGVAGWFMRSSDIRAHGLDEKIGIAEFHAGTEFWYRMLKTLSQP
jgi:acetylornithine deacetylase/succinyl-diaminopimelate desuccinylase-like protein